MKTQKTLPILLLLSTLFFAGCKDDDPKVSAPGFIKPHLYHLYKTVPDCFKANDIVPDKKHDYTCDLFVKTVPATGEYKGHPLFVHEGKTVAGITFGNCNGHSVIYMPVFGERYSKEVLQHEVCHAYDICKPCRKGHPSEYGLCCPHWPYIKSLSDTNESIEVYCLNTEVTTATTNMIVSITTFGDDVSVMNVDENWILNLIDSLEQ